MARRFRYGQRCEVRPGEGLPLVAVQATALRPRRDDSDAGPLSGSRIRAIRRGLGLSQEQLGQLVGFGWTTVSRWERGRTCPNEWHTDLLLSLERVIDFGDVGDTVKASILQRGAIPTLAALLRLDTETTPLREAM